MFILFAIGAPDKKEYMDIVGSIEDSVQLPPLLQRVQLTTMSK